MDREGESRKQLCFFAKEPGAMGYREVKWYKEHLTSSFLVFAVFFVTLGNLLPLLASFK